MNANERYFIWVGLCFWLRLIRCSVNSSYLFSHATVRNKFKQWSERALYKVNSVGLAEIDLKLEPAQNAGVMLR